MLARFTLERARKIVKNDDDKDGVVKKIKGSFSSLYTYGMYMYVLFIVVVFSFMMLSTTKQHVVSTTGRELFGVEDAATAANNDSSWTDDSLTPLQERFAVVHGCIDKHERCSYDDRRGYFTALLFALLPLSSLCGVDRCYMGFVCCGVFKGLTLGGLLIWSMVDTYSLISGNWMYDENGCCPVLGLKPL